MNSTLLPSCHNNARNRPTSSRPVREILLEIAYLLQTSKVRSRTPAIRRRMGRIARSRIVFQRGQTEDEIVATLEERLADLHLLVVIDHHEARVYQTEVHGAIPMQLVPYDPHGHGKHLHSAHESTDGKRQPERKSFYEAIAKTLQGADQILLYGSGTGRSSAMEMLLTDLKAHHKDIAEKIIGSVVVDAHHTTENQLLAKARDFYAEFNRK
jgi:hypothetical protein